MGPQQHPYSLESRKSWTPWLVVAGMGLAFAWGAIQDTYQLKIPAVVDTPATVGFYGFLVWLINNWGIRTPFVARLLGAPLLTGKYNVVSRSSHDGYANERRGTAEIQQTWTELCVHMRWEASESWSEAAHVLKVATGGGYQVVFLYRNEPGARSDESMKSHLGTCSLRLSEDGKSLSGEYYTGKGRSTVGTLEMTRVP